jgi:hypothetical protein
LLAVGSSLAALPAAALELGDLKVQSGLGQPLRASIAYALAPNEQISTHCVSLGAGPTDNGLPGIGPAELSVANGVIKLTGNTTVREPMMAASVMINCPYAPNISREYMLFVDPQVQSYEITAVPQQATATNNEASASLAATPVARRDINATTKPQAAPRTSAPVRKDLHSGDRVQVRPNDTLGEITQRIADRGVGLWPAVMMVFEANPDSFLDNDPNKLKAGSWLTIPDFAAPGMPVTATTVSATTVESTPVADTSSLAELTTTEVREEEVVVTTNDLQPAAVNDDPLIAPSLAENTAVLDTNLPGPTTQSTSPNVATAGFEDKALDTSSPVATSNPAEMSWLWWLGGSGIALILGLLLFGRRLTNRGAAAVALAADHPARRLTDVATQDAAGNDSDADFSINDESPTEENLALDANLVIGTEMDDRPDVSVNDNFNYASQTKLDIELPFEPIAASDTTNVLMPQRTDEHSILDSEVLPTNDAFEPSIVSDASKTSSPEVDTAYDLHAVVVETDDRSLSTDNYTINKEVDFDILEQDYEDELTATQALNQEITRAATELASRADRNKSEADDETSVLPLATVTEIDVTSQLPAISDDVADDDATGVNATLTEVQLRDDNTVEMPASNIDGDTVDMKVGSGKNS